MRDIAGGKGTSRNVRTVSAAFVALLWLLPWSVSAQTVVTQYQPGVTVEGVTYCLPKTGFRVVVTAEKKVFTPGELNKYAERYLRLGDVRTQAETQWVIRDIRLDAFGAPDTSKFYSIALRDKTKAPYVTLAPDGRLMAIRDVAQEPKLPELPQPVAAKPAPDARRYFTQEMLAVGNKAKLSELAAQEIFDIRESYNALVRGEAENSPKDGKQLELMLQTLGEQEAALTSLFAGTELVSTEVFTFNVVPDKVYDKLMVARFGDVVGLVDADNLAGAPLYLTVRALEPLPLEQDDADARKKKAKMQNSVRYNIPVKMEVTIADARKTYVKQEMMMGQFGRVEILSDVLFNKNATTRVQINPVTGGLVNIAEE